MTTTLTTLATLASVFRPSTLHAVAAVGSDAVVGVDLARNDPDVQVMLGAFSPVRTLA